MMSQDLFGEVVVIKRNGSDGARFPFRTSQCTFGRNQDCDIRIQLPNVSQEHAKLYVEQGKIFLQNLSKGIPTLLNKNDIETQELKHNDIFTISERSFRFELPVRRKSSSGRRSSSSSRKTPLKALQGSPRTPLAGEPLKKSITKLRKSSSVVEEEDESKQTPKSTRDSPKCASPEYFQFKENTPEEQLLQTTPSILKKRKSINTVERKRVSFGASLSPELFDKSLPPSTPLKKGKSPSRRMSEPIQKRTPKERTKKRCSVGTVLKEMPIVVEEEEPKEEEAAFICSIERPQMPTNEIPLHIAVLADTPPQGLPSPLISSTNDSTNSCPPNEDKSLKLKLATPVREAIQKGVKLKESKRKLATPLRKDIKQGLKLKATKRKLATPVRQQIRSGVTLRNIRQRMHTPLRKDIHARPQLRKVVKKIATPLKKEIESKPTLKTTKQKMATPLKKDIQTGLKLKKTKPTLAAKLQEEIKSRPLLKATKRKLATPLRQQIKEKPKLKATLKKLATPLRVEIKSGLKLRATKRKLATPLRKEIESAPKLKATKKSLAKDLQEEIVKGKDLRSKYADVPKLPQDVQHEIVAGKSLRKTLKSAPTPLRREIKDGVTLRATKKIMRKSLQEEIRSRKQLQKTMLSAPTPLKDEIKAGKQLKKTKQSASTPFREEIKKGVKLRVTKKKLAVDLQNEIQQGKALKKTKIAAPTPFRNEIKKGVRLRQTKKKLDADLQNEIQQGKALKKTKVAAPTPFRNEIKKGVRLRQTKKKLDADLQNEIQQGKALRRTKIPAPTPLRKAIKKGVKLRQTKKQLRLSLQSEIQAGRLLRPVLQKSLKTPIRAQIKAGVSLRRTSKTQSNSLVKETTSRRISLRSSDKDDSSSTKAAACELPTKDEAAQRKFLRAKRRVKRLQEKPPQFNFLQSVNSTRREKIKQPAKKRVCRRSTPNKMVVSAPEETMANELESEQNNTKTLVTPKLSNNEKSLQRLLSQEGYNDMSPVIALEPVFITKDQEVRLTASGISDSHVSETSGEESGILNGMPSFSQLLKNADTDNCSQHEEVEEDKDDVFEVVDDKPQDVLDDSKLLPITAEEGKEIEESTVEDFFLQRLLKSPKDKVQNSLVEENLGLKRLLKTPKEKVQNLPVEEKLGLKRLLKTPKEMKTQCLPVQENFGLKRLLKTPKEKSESLPVEENFGLKRLLKTPKEKQATDSTSVEDNFGLERLMQTPKEGVVSMSTEIENDISLDELMKTPDSLESDDDENTAPCLIGLIQITKMPIHEVEHLCGEDMNAQESSIDIGILPKLFKSPKEALPPLDDLNLQSLFPEVEPCAQNGMETAVDTEAKEIEKKPRSSRKKASSQIKKAVGNRRSTRHTVSKTDQGTKDIAFFDLAEDSNNEEISSTDETKATEPTAASDVKTNEQKKEENGDKEKNEAENMVNVVRDVPVQRTRSLRVQMEDQADVLKEDADIEKLKPSTVDETKVDNSTGNSESGELSDHEKQVIEETELSVNGKNVKDSQPEEELDLTDIEPTVKNRSKAGRTKGTTKQSTRSSSRVEDKKKVSPNRVEIKECPEDPQSSQQIATKSVHRQTRSSGRKIIEQDDTHVDAKQRVKSRKSVNAAKSNAEESSDKLAGVGKGVVVTPVKVHVQKTQLKSIPEETEADLMTPASKPAVRNNQTRKRKISLAEKEKETLQSNPAASQQMKTVRQTRRSCGLSHETSSSVESFVQDKKGRGRRASRSTRVAEQVDSVLTSTDGETNSEGEAKQNDDEETVSTSRAARSKQSSKTERNVAVSSDEAISTAAESQAVVAELERNKSVGRASRPKRSRNTEVIIVAASDNDTSPEIEYEATLSKRNPSVARASRAKTSEKIEENVAATSNSALSDTDNNKINADERKETTKRSTRSLRNQKTSNNAEKGAVEEVPAVSQGARALRSKPSRKVEENVAAQSNSVFSDTDKVNGAVDRKESGRRSTRSLRNQKTSIIADKVQVEESPAVSQDYKKEVTRDKKKEVTRVTRKRKRDTAAANETTTAVPSSIDESDPVSKKSKRSNTAKETVTTRKTRSTRSRRR